MILSSFGWNNPCLLISSFYCCFSSSLQGGGTSQARHAGVVFFVCSSSPQGVAVVFFAQAVKILPQQLLLNEREFDENIVILCCQRADAALVYRLIDVLAPLIRVVETVPYPSTVRQLQSGGGVSRNP